jgi:hypothetical protein
MPTVNGLESLRRALEARGIIFVDGNGDGPDVGCAKAMARSGRLEPFARPQGRMVYPWPARPLAGDAGPASDGPILD